MIDKEIIRNQPGYYDETAGKAILNIEREKKMNNKTGEILFIGKVVDPTLK